MSQKFKPGWVYSYPVSNGLVFLLCLDEDGKAITIATTKGHKDRLNSLTSLQPYAWSSVREEFEFTGPVLHEVLARLTTKQEE